MPEPSEKRLGGTLKFDPLSEGYIVDKVNELSKKGALSSFLIKLIRIAFDNPDKLKREKDLQDLLEFMGSNGMTPLAEQHYKEAKRQTTEMRQKVDAIYDMCLKMYTLSQFGKTLGLEERTKNIARVEFILERQLSDLRDTLGVRDYNLFESSKILDIEDKSGEVLEYIIDHYSNVVGEIKADVCVNVPVEIAGIQRVETGKAGKTGDSVIAGAKDSETLSNAESVTDETPKTKDILGELDSGEPINFGEAIADNADMDILEKFFGEGG